MTNKSTPPPSKASGANTRLCRDSGGRLDLPALTRSYESSTFTLRATDAASIFTYRWLATPSAKAVVQIVHGITEHAGRYARLAAALTRAGYHVYANDHRGHGRTAQFPGGLGLLAEQGGWRKCLDDLWMQNLGAKSRSSRKPRLNHGWTPRI